MSVLKVKCIDQVLTIVNAPLIASGDIQTDVVQFEFCPMWDGYVKTAIFYRNENEVYPVLVDIDSTAVIPQEVLKEEGLLYFGVHGVLDNQVRTSQVLRYRIVKGALVDETVIPDPTPDIYSQILTKIEEAGLHIYHATEDEIEELLLHGREGNGLITLSRLNQYNEGLAEDTGQTVGEAKEIQLKRDGLDASPLTYIDSIKNADGSSFKESLQEALDLKSDSDHTHTISDVADLQKTLDSKGDVYSVNDEQSFTTSGTYLIIPTFNRRLFDEFPLGGITFFNYQFTNNSSDTVTIRYRSYTSPSTAKYIFMTNDGAGVVSAGADFKITYIAKGNTSSLSGFIVRIA